MSTKKELLRRKQEMEQMISEGYKFEEYQPYLEEAEHDPELALYYLIRDLVIRLKQARKAKNLTQGDVALRMGTKQAAISRCESLSSLPSIQFLIKYASAIGEQLHAQVGSELSICIPQKLAKKAETLFGSDPENVRRALLDIIQNRLDKTLQDFSEVMATFTSTNVTGNVNISQDINVLGG